MDPSLPRLLVIADGFTQPRQRDRILALAAAGVLPWVQLRDHRARPVEFAACARDLTRELKRVRPSTRISVNGYPDLAVDLDVGVHLGFRNETPAVARAQLGEELLIGYSAHAGVDMAVIAQCHYITFSPVFPVQRKPAAIPLRIERLSYIAGRIVKPVFALGGVSVGRVAECLDAGAFGVAVLSGVMAADDPVDAAARYLVAIEEWTRIRP